jgi:hypothetical protein
MKRYNKLIFILFIALATAASILYSENEKLFPHGTHKENDVECIACHPQAKTSTKARENLYPKKAVCTGECHEKDILDGIAFVSSKPKWDLSLTMKCMLTRNWSVRSAIRHYM